MSRVPPRDPGTPSRLIDLSRYYHASLADSWGGSPDDRDDNSLSELKAGIQTLAGVPFDVRGIVQLGSLHGYPRRVSGIPVGLNCRSLHFLHAASWAVDPKGTRVGHYRVNFADGRSEDIPLVLGTNIEDWTVGPNDPWPDSVAIAWEGAGESARRRRLTNRLYRFTWQNPRPEQEVRTLDFVWAAMSTEPFLVAMTAE